MKRILTLSLLALAGVALVAGFALAKSKGKGSPWMGVYTQTVDKDLAEAFDLDTDYGAVINDVVDDSPADQAGLREDDIILMFNGNKVMGDRELRKLVEDASVGDAVTLTILRRGQEKQVKVTLGAFEGEDVRVWSFSSPQSPSKSYTFNWSSDKAYGYAGVSLLGISDELAGHFGAAGGGVLINTVEEESPAAKAGLKVGDVIVAIDGEEVDEVMAVVDLIHEKDDGEIARFEVIRSGRPATVEVPIELRKDASFGFGPGVMFFDDDNFDWRRLPGFGRTLDLRRAITDDTDVDGEMSELRKELKDLGRELQELKKSLE
jgi:serine protease Do